MGEQSWRKMDLRPRVINQRQPGALELVSGLLWVITEEHRNGEWRPLQPHELAVRGLTPSTALNYALKRLQNAASPFNWHSIKEAPGVHVFTTGDARSAAHLLLLKQRFTHWPEGGVIAGCPSEDLLVCTSIHQVEDLDRLILLADACRVAASHAQHPLTDQLFWCDGERWFHLPVVCQGDQLHIIPPASFRKSLDHLAALGLVAMAGEA